MVSLSWLMRVLPFLARDVLCLFFFDTSKNRMFCVYSCFVFSFIFPWKNNDKLITYVDLFSLIVTAHSSMDYVSLLHMHNIVGSILKLFVTYLPSCEIQTLHILAAFEKYYEFDLITKKFPKVRCIKLLILILHRYACF